MDRFIVLLFQLIYCSDLLSITVSQHEEAPPMFPSSDQPQVVGFYNIYAAGDFRQIVEQQVSVVRDSGLLERVDSIYYATIAPPGENLVIDTPKFTHIKHHGDTGEEMDTLALLYEYCHANPASKVFYFHNKGSFHNSAQNQQFRRFLNCFVLNPSCISTLDTHDTCGWRVSPVPHIHYSGNFWWATCRHINGLVHPLSPVKNQTFIDLGATLARCVATHTRVFAESWVGSAPDIKPADCMNASVDSTYVYGYYNFPSRVADTYCPRKGPPLSYGLPCDTASIWLQPHKFLNSIEYLARMGGAECRGSLIKDLTLRSRYWYGQDPHTYLAWMEKLYEPEKPYPDGSLLRGVSSRQVYYVRGGLLCPIGYETFMRMGLDFDDVKAIPEVEVNVFLPHGEPM